MAEYWNDKREALLAKERGTLFKVDGPVSIALCYPHSYFIGMSNLGFHTAYWHFNQAEGAKAERMFYEPDEKEQRTLETGRILSDFPYVGFSVAFELDYPHILAMLSRAQIPLLRSERGEEHPLVFAGGFVTFFNFKPLIPFLDFIIVGEGEEVFAPVVAVLKEGRVARRSKKEICAALAALPGVYVPGVSGAVEPRMVQDLNAYETISRIITPDTEFSNMFLVELARGCLHRCSFCVSGHVYEKQRMRSIKSIIASCERGRELTSRIGFIASAPSDYPDIDELCAYVKRHQIHVSFSSLRISSIKRPLLELLRGQGNGSLTLAPETGSERLRRTIQKTISDEMIYRVVEEAYAVGFSRLKLYMMIGLPDEEEGDLEASCAMVKRIAAKVQVRVSMTPFIPKPHTPFAQYSLSDRRILKEKMTYLKRAFQRMRGVTVSFDGFQTAHLQALYAKGDETTLLNLAQDIARKSRI